MEKFNKEVIEHYAKNIVGEVLESIYDDSEAQSYELSEDEFKFLMATLAAEFKKRA